MTEKNTYLIAGDAFMRRAEYDALLKQLQKKIEGVCEVQSFDITDTP